LRHQAQNTVTQMMRMYEYIKQSGATPVLQEQHARCGEFSTLEDLFEQTVSDYQKRINALTSLTEDAQAANDKSAINPEAIQKRGNRGRDAVANHSG
jgi:ferritin-like protein 2